MIRLTVALVLAVGCSTGTEKVALPDGPQGQIQATDTSTNSSIPLIGVEERDLARAVRATGSTRALRKGDLGTDTVGRILEIAVEENDHVEEGQLLVRVDVVEERALSARAAAQAISATVEAKRAASEYERLEPLAAQGVIPSSRLEDVQAHRDAAREVARAAHAAARAAQQLMREGVLKAPFAGTIVDVPVEVGEMATGSGQTLIRMLDLTTLEVSVRVHEDHLAQITAGDEAIIHLASVARQVEGRVARVGYEIDEDTRTGEVIVRIPNAARELRAGMFCEVEVQPHNSRRGLVVPTGAVFGGAEQRFVLVVEEGKAARRAVTVRSLDSEYWEVLEGLRAGDEVVAGGMGAAKEGALIGTSKPNAEEAAQVHPPAGTDG